MAEALRRQASAIVTVGSIHSNHARITTMVARRLGLQCALILNGDANQEAKGNFYLSKLLGANLYFVDSREDRVPKMEAIAEDLKRRGETVYKVPLGCSDSIGSLGLVAAMEEVVLQMQELGVHFDAIVLASSSGGTQAGLEAGKKLFGLDGLEIIGISPDDSADSIRRTVSRLATEMIRNLGMDSGVTEEEVQVYDQYVGPGYGMATEESQEATRLFSLAEGLLLDPFYTSKAAAALLDFCRQQRFSPESHVLFWHTGGLVNLFQ
jgi:1-aminocyclopropane-1-carboxylate deaminase/D-cysteine desulfhydrase-like pyridoxal-dependent ACC family enzyme